MTNEEKETMIGVLKKDITKYIDSNNGCVKISPQSYFEDLMDAILLNREYGAELQSVDWGHRRREESDEND